MLSSLIGRPWKAEARGPDAFDCKGLVAFVLREHFQAENQTPSLLLPADSTDWCAVRKQAQRNGWKRIEGRPTEKDILVCYGTQGAHVGIFVRYGKLGVLHSVGQETVGSGVRFNLLDEILSGGYGKPEIWRFCGTPE